MRVRARRLARGRLYRTAYPPPPPLLLASKLIRREIGTRFARLLLIQSRRTGRSTGVRALRRKAADSLLRGTNCSVVQRTFSWKYSRNQYAPGRASNRPSGYLLSITRAYRRYDRGAVSPTRNYTAPHRAALIYVESARSMARDQYIVFRTHRALSQQRPRHTGERKFILMYVRGATCDPVSVPGAFAYTRERRLFVLRCESEKQLRSLMRFRGTSATATGGSHANFYAPTHYAARGS